MLLRALATVALSVSLVACGGGGGDSGGGGDGSAPVTFTLGGTVSGLASGASVVLANSGGGTTTVSNSGAFTFPAAVASGSAYAVTVQAQPANQTCTVTNGAGTAIANVSNVTVACVTNVPNTFSVGGSVSGLASGASVVLRNNGGNDLTVAGNGVFTFDAVIATGGAYAVAVRTQPSGQTCTVANAAGTIASANVTSVAVTCVTHPPSTFTIGGTVSGLAGAGLVLRNGGDNLAIAANGAFTFSSAINTGGQYEVTVGAQPSLPTQICDVSSGSGTVASANIANVTVSCTTSLFTVGGTVTGLAGTGLVLRNADGDDLPVSADGAFTFATPIESGLTYAVTVLTQPSSPTQTCVVSNDTGTVAAAAVTDVALTCTTSEFTVGGTISGLTADGLELSNNEGTPLVMAPGETSFTFPEPVASGSTYEVTVSQQPSSQTCSVSNETGTVTDDDVSDVSVECASVFAFITNSAGTRRVASYSVGSDGGFTQVSAVPSPDGPVTGVAATASGDHVIVAFDPSNSADGALRVYSVSNTGVLEYVPNSRVPLGHPTYSHTTGCGAWNLVSGSISCGLRINSAPETVLIHPNGRFVYVMDGVAGGACTPIDPMVPVVGPCTPANGGNPAAGNRVIVRFTFDPATGALTYHDRHYVEGFVSFAMDPQGRFVWGTSYLEHKIYEFSIDQSTGALTSGPGTYIGMANGQMWLGIDPSGRYAYAAHETDRTIDSYTINQTTGHLTNIGSINGNCGAPGANCNKATNVVAESLVVSADSRTLYGASSGVLAYALGVDGSIGAALPGSPFPPSTPLSGGSNRAKVAKGPAGQYLYLLGYSDSAARVFSIDSSTGALTEADVSPTPLVGGTSGITALFLQ
jgi:6-phosphogluconolactonase (cycloisomerase 2 family)